MTQEKVEAFDPYPMDLSTLERGDVVPTSELVRMSGIDPLTKETPQETLQANQSLRLWALAFGESVRKHFQDERGETVDVRIMSDGVHVLTPEDQHEYSKRNFYGGVRKLYRAHRSMVANDVAGLTDEQRQERLRLMTTNSWKLQQLRKKAPPELTNKES